MKNPGACWSPPNTGTCKSPVEFRRLLTSGSQAPFFHTPPLRSACPVGYELQMLPKAQIATHQRRNDSGNLASFLEVPRDMVLENYMVPSPMDRDDDYRTLTMDIRAGKISNRISRKNNQMIGFDSGLLLPNTWTEANNGANASYSPHTHLSRSRMASSMEDLKEDVEGDSKECKSSCMQNNSAASSASNAFFKRKSCELRPV